MNLYRIFVYFCLFIIIPIIAESYKKIIAEGRNCNEIKENHEIVQRNSFGPNQQILDSEINLNQKLYSKSRTEIVDISKEKNLIHFGDGDKDILFVSTLDGYIHAIDSNNNELWKISLGKSLINSHLQNYNILEQNSIIPDLDGNIYLYSMQNDNKLTKIDIPIKTLIDSSPFTLPNIPNTIFLGDKKSSIFTIDIEKGIILSKISSSGGSMGYINKKPIQTNNLLTVIRTDYTLSSFNQVLGTQSWNVTVSDIMAIQKGSKNEIAVNWKKENSNDLMGKISKLLENPNLNSIVSIHNYISDSHLPVKIYDNKKAFNPLNSEEDIDFEAFLNLNKDKFFRNLANKDKHNNNFNGDDMANDRSNREGKSLPTNFIERYHKSPYYFDPNDRNRINNNEEIRINYDQIFRDYLNYTRSKLKENSKFFSYNGMFGKFLYKFWELYYFDDYFTLYMSVFTILVGIIVLLIFIILRIRDKNNKLKDKLKLRKKSSESIEENMNNNNKSTTNARENQQSPNEISKDDDINLNNGGEITCYQTDSGAICVYSENKNIENLRKIINEKINNDKIKKQNNSNEDLIIITNDDEKSTLTEDELPEHQKLLDMQSIQIHQEAQLNLMNNKQFEELFKPQLDLNLKNAEIQNKVESTFCFLKDTDGKIIKIENKQLITKYDDNPEVAERIMQVTGQIGLINIPDSKTVTVHNDEKANEGVICQYNKYNSENTFAVYCNKTNGGTKVSERKFSENIEFSRTNSNNFNMEFSDKNMQNSEEFVRAKSNDTKKPDFQPIQFSIKALKEKDKTEFTFEKGTLSSLGLGNASTDSNYFKNDSKSDVNTKDINAKQSTTNGELTKTENSLVLVRSKNNNIMDNNIVNNNNKLCIYNEKSKSKFQFSVKDRSKSKQKNGKGNFLNDSNQKENMKNNNISKINQDKEDLFMKNSPADNKKNKAIKTNEPKEYLVNNKNNIDKNNQDQRNTKHLCSTSKTNNLNLKCKYKEYKEFNIANDPNEKNKLLKIDTTLIDEGRIGKNFEEFSKVGEGGFGSVFKAKHKIDGSLYAIKVIKLDVGISQSLKDHKVIKEVKTMMKLYHKNVVRYYTCWYQLNIDEIKNLKSESDEESQITSSCVTNSNNNLILTRTYKKKNTGYNKNSSSNYSESFFGSVSNFQKNCVKKETRKKMAFESGEGFSEASRSKQFLNNNNHYKNNNNKLIKKINFNNVRDKSLNNSKYYESPEKSKKNINASFYNDYYNTYNSKSKSLTRNNKSYLNLHSTCTKNRISLNPFIELNATKSAILNQISENGESDFNSNNQSGAGGFNWEDSNFISKRNNESYEKSQMENTRRRGRSSENSKMDISYNGNSFWNESKKDYLESSIKNVNFASNNKSNMNDNNENNIEAEFSKCKKYVKNKNEKVAGEKVNIQIRKFSSLTEEINPDNNLYEKKAFSISLEKNAEEILSDSNDEEIRDESYFSNEESKNNSKFSRYNNKNNNNGNKNKNTRKMHAQDDSVIDLTRRNKKKKKEFVYNVYFLVQMEFCDGLSLNQYLEINKNNGLNRQIIFSFFKQILSGVNQIHKSNIIHRDLKPHNIFVIGENSLKIGDFGLAYDLENYARQKKLNNSNNKNANVNNMSSSNLLANFDNSFIKIDEFVGTPLYQSPEQIKELAYNEKVDIYAMGLILYEMCACFKTGMERRLSIEKLRNEHKIEDKIYSKYSIESELILWMTRVKPSDRPSAQEILNSEKFKNWKKQFSD